MLRFGWLGCRMGRRFGRVEPRGGWYRHITLSMLAHAFLAATAASCHPASSDTAAQKGTQRLWTTAGHPQRP
jgi:hypothetical protein